MNNVNLQKSVDKTTEMELRNICGENAYRKNEIMSVRELIKSLMQEHVSSASGTDL